MTRRVIVIPPDLALSHAWLVMQQERFRHLPVVKDGALLGMLSDRDVLRHSRPASGGLDVPDIPAEEAMSPAPYVCMPDTHVADVVRTLTEHKIDALPVVDEDSRIVGLITSTDLLLLLIELDEAKVPLPFEFELDSYTGRPAAQLS